MDAGDLFAHADRPDSDGSHPDRDHSHGRPTMTATTRPDATLDIEKAPKKGLGDLRVAMGFLLPALIGFLVFYVAPAIRGIYISLTDWNLLANTGELIGLDNYRMLFEDPLFSNALKVTGLYVAINIGSQTILAVLIAVLMDRLTRSITVRSIMLLPWLVPNVVVALLWLWLLDKNVGIVNAGLEAIGIEPIAFFGRPEWVMPTIAGVNTWRHMGYTALLIFAGLKTIPSSMYEAAAVDGATEFQMFRRVTIPLLRPVLALVLVITVIGSFQVFDTVNVATGGFGGRPGGPINSSRVIYLLIFENAFSRNNFGYAAAIAVALTVILLAVTVIQLRLLRAGESDLA